MTEREKAGEDAAKHSGEVLRYLDRLYAEGGRHSACRATNPNELDEWQRRARPKLRELIGLELITEASKNHRVEANLGPREDLGEYTRQRGSLASEPNVEIPFWILRPKKGGPRPLGIFPHGHSDYGMDSYAGIAHDEQAAARNEREQRDVAVQAVQRGFVAIAPNTRGFRPAVIPDLNGRHGNRDCRSHLLHCLLAGRTPIGERVWDMMNLITWGRNLPDVAEDKVLMMGNSGGGVVTIYTAACDTRVRVAVPSCSFCTYVGRGGLIHHCDCNAVPGILSFGEFYDVAGLIAPRHLCIVNGRMDRLFPSDEVDRAFAALARVYRSAGALDHLTHRWGEGGHRFYGELMWPFVEKALS